MGKHSLFDDGATGGDDCDGVGDTGLVAHVERYEDAPDECTIYPGDVAGEELVTHWLSAAEGSYVSLAAMR